VSERDASLPPAHEAHSTRRVSELEARSSSVVDLERVRRAAGSTPDPEVRKTIAELGLLDDVQADGGKVKVLYHLTSPLCPSKFATKIGLGIRKRVEAVPGVESCEVILQDHFVLDEIYDLINVRVLT
jgi:metal-sulfur cluster biosynthetic enzyme